MLSKNNPNYRKQRMLFVYGPTASGKSDLAMHVAQHFGGEIIAADSQTVRRGMDIGTAKPTVEDQKAVPHHLLDVIDPYGRFTVFDFKRLAESAIEGIQSRGRLPIIVGGTGLYMDALLYDFSMRPSAGEHSREELEEMRVDQLQGIITDEGYEMPQNKQNPRHLIRTIETQGQVPQKQEPRAGAIIVGIDPGVEKLQQRISLRADAMLEAGLSQEISNLVEKYGSPKQDFDAILYKIIYKNHNIDANELKEKMIIGDRQYAKKQRSWLRRNDDITWFEDPENAFEYLKKLL